MGVSLMLVCAWTLLAAVPEDHLAPVPVLGRGSAVPFSGHWHVVDAQGRSTPARPGPEAPWVELTAPGAKSARIETRPAATVKAWHVYRLAVPVRGVPGMGVDVGLIVSGRKDRPSRRFRIWPRRHAANAVSPSGSVLTGYVIVPPGSGSQAVAYVSGRIPVKVGRPILVGVPTLTDVGPVPARRPATLLVDGFEHWTDAGMPWGHHAAFTKPGQFAPIHDKVHDGRTAARNRGGRALLFGPFVPCRFGTVVRIRVWARGKGRVDMWGTPYLGRVGRGAGPCSVSFSVNGDWRPCEIVLGQHLPEADTLRPCVDVHGKVTVDTLSVERLTPPRAATHRR